MNTGDGNSEQDQIKVLYDGRCHLCSFEIAHYLKKDLHHRLKPVDITAADFKAESFGLDAAAINLRMHVILPDGQIKFGMDSFIEIWKVLPGGSLPARIVNLPLIRPLADLAYDIFALWIRPRLPKKKSCPL